MVPLRAWDNAEDSVWPVRVAARELGTRTRSPFHAIGIKRKILGVWGQRPQGWRRNLRIMMSMDSAASFGDAAFTATAKEKAN
jgi:hypothetical protein